jgi:hypothetical protein
MSNPNTYVKFPLNFQPGLGYSNSSGPPQGGWPSNPGPGFYGQPMFSLLPSGFGIRRKSIRRKKYNKRKSIRRKKSRSFGNCSYPLMNQPSSIIDMQTFPKYPVGPGNTLGGTGGVPLQGGPSFEQYWGFGKKTSRKSRKSHKNHRRMFG